MDTQTIILAAGVILLVTGILGGGIEVKEVKIPQLNSLARWLSVFTGVVLLTVSGDFPIGFPASSSVSASESVQSETDAGGATREPVEPQTAFLIGYQLGRASGVRELEAEVYVSLNGEKVANLSVNSGEPSQSVSVTVPKPGEYTYTIDGHTVISYTKGSSSKKIPLVGRGEIKVNKGDSFDVAIELKNLNDETVQNLPAFLVEQSVSVNP